MNERKLIIWLMISAIFTAVLMISLFFLMIYEETNKQAHIDYPVSIGKTMVLGVDGSKQWLNNELNAAEQAVAREEQITSTGLSGEETNNYQSDDNSNSYTNQNNNGDTNQNVGSTENTNQNTNIIPSSNSQPSGGGFVEDV